MDCELLWSSWAGSKRDLQKAEEGMTASVRPLIFRMPRLGQSGSSIEKLRWEFWQEGGDCVALTGTLKY